MSTDQNAKMKQKTEKMLEELHLQQIRKQEIVDKKEKQEQDKRNDLLLGKRLI